MWVMLGRGRPLAGGGVDGDVCMNRFLGLGFIEPNQMLITTLCAFFSSYSRIGRMKSSTSNAPADVARYAPDMILAALSYILLNFVYILAVCPFSPWGVY